VSTGHITPPGRWQFRGFCHDFAITNRRSRHAGGHPGREVAAM